LIRDPRRLVRSGATVVIEVVVAGIGQEPRPPRLHLLPGPAGARGCGFSVPRQASSSGNLGWRRGFAEPFSSPWLSRRRMPAERGEAVVAGAAPAWPESGASKISAGQQAAASGAEPSVAAGAPGSLLAFTAPASAEQEPLPRRCRRQPMGGHSVDGAPGPRQSAAPAPLGGASDSARPEETAPSPSRGAGWRRPLGACTKDPPLPVGVVPDGR